MFGVILDSYFLADVNGFCSKCSGNVETIANVKECRLAVSKCGTDSRFSVVNWSNAEKGCFEYDGYFYWNNNLGYNLQKTRATPVCKSRDVDICGN